MIVVDASVMVSWLVPHDVHHAVSARWLAQQVASKTRIVAPNLLLTEVGGAIARRTGDAALGHQAVNQIQRLPLLRLVPIDHRLGLLATQLAVDLRLRGAYAVYVAVAHRLRIPLASWDREHHTRAGRIITVLNPNVP